MAERLRRIVAAMGLRPGDKVLEVGCGHGVAADFICERLTTGRLLAIDRSEKMIAAAAARNEAHVKSGKAVFLLTALEDADFGRRRFNKILAVRVGLFHREPARARALAERWLAPGGKIFALYDAPG